MKKTDIAMIILIASVSVLIAYFVANALPIFKDGDKAVTVKTAEKIVPDIKEPDTTVFNKDAINPTVEVIIGGTTQAPTSTKTTSETDK